MSSSASFINTNVWLYRLFDDKKMEVAERTRKRDIAIASDICSRYNFSFWDSLIVSCALSARASILYSEDMQDGLIVAGQLVIVNPFKKG